MSVASLSVNHTKGPRKPSIFIGSSSEGLAVANQVAEILSANFEVSVWDQRIFQLGESTIEGLARIVQAFDFAVLVFTDDETLSTVRPASSAIQRLQDKVARWISRGTSHFAAPRDNVVFELGMFYGAKGRRRSFAIVVPTERGRPKIPSDLAGVTLTFATRPDGEDPTKESLSKDIGPIEQAIFHRFEHEADFEMLPSTGSAVGYFLNFVAPVCAELRRLEAFETADGTFDLRSGNFEFRIVLPDSLNDANQTSAEHYCSTRGLQPTHIQTPYRKFPFWVQPSTTDGKVMFWDYPTTLKSSDEAVKYVTRSAYLSSGPIRRAMEKRELANFEKVIGLMLNSTSEGAPFRDNVKIHHIGIKGAVSKT
jgi:predicted nucleotide-binding protein